MRPHQVGPEHREPEAELAEVVPLLGADELRESCRLARMEHHQRLQHQGTQPGPHEVPATEEIADPVRLQRHDAIERDDGHDNRIEWRKDPGQPVDAPMIGALVVPLQHPLIARAPRTADAVLYQRQIRQEVTPDKGPAHHEQHHQATHHSCGHPRVGEPAGFSGRDTAEGLLHVAVDVVIAEREDQDQADQRHREEPRRGLRKAEDHA